MDKTQFSLLRKMFRELAKSVVDGVPGIWVVRSEKPGPTVGITILTHGNEPSGLYVYHYLRYIYKLEKKLQRGTVYVVLNNIRATERYFAARSEAGKRKARFVDVNMNRLPDNVLERRRDNRYEIRRARELRKIWNRFQYGLDIHSTSQTTRPMVIKLARSDTRVVSRFPIRTVIANIDEVQSGKPPVYFYGNRQAAVYGIEAGGHEIGRSLIRARACAKALLASLKIIPEPLPPRTPDQEEYAVFGSVWFPDESYELVRRMRTFERARKGQVIATGDGPPIVIPRNACLLMVPKDTKPNSIKEEVMFLARPPRKSGR